MKKDFIPYELALELKQLGFDEPCFGYYSGPKTKHTGLIWYEMPNKGQDSIPVGDILAPTYSQCFRWFREKHNLKSWIQEHRSDTFIYKIRPHVLSDYKQGETYVYTNYEKVELACLKKLIEIVKNNHGSTII